MRIELQPGDAVLDKLIDAAQSGEEVVLSSAGRPVVKLVALSCAVQSASRIPGRLRGKLQLPPNWVQAFDKMDDEITGMMLDAPLTTDGTL